MKKLVALLTLACVATFASASPTDADIAAYTQRAGFYVALGQTPDQVAVSLRNWFGKPYFFPRSNGWDYTYDIQWVEGSGLEITNMVTLATMKGK